MKITSANIAAFIVGIVALVGAVVLLALHDVVPGYVWAIALAGITAGAGLSVPAGIAATPTLPGLGLSPTIAVDLKQLAVEVLNHLSTTAPAPTAPAPSPSAAAVIAAGAPFYPSATASSAPPPATFFPATPATPTP